MSERPEQGTSNSPNDGFFLSTFFHDAYDKGVVTAIEEHPGDAAAAAIGGALAGSVFHVLDKSLANIDNQSLTHQPEKWLEPFELPNVFSPGGRMTCLPEKLPEGITNLEITAGPGV